MAPICESRTGKLSFLLYPESASNIPQTRLKEFQRILGISQGVYIDGLGLTSKNGSLDLLKGAEAYLLKQLEHEEDEQPQSPHSALRLVPPKGFQGQLIEYHHPNIVENYIQIRPCQTAEGTLIFDKSWKLRAEGENLRKICFVASQLMALPKSFLYRAIEHGSAVIIEIHGNGRDKAKYQLTELELFFPNDEKDGIPIPNIRGKIIDDPEAQKELLSKRRAFFFFLSY